MDTYASVADFEDYMPGWETTDEDELVRLLDRASRDVDELLGPLRPREAPPFLGLKVNPDRDLTPLGRSALSRATCAQAAHRFRFLEPALASAVAAANGAPVERKVSAVKGPEFETSYFATTDAPAGALLDAVGATAGKIGADVVRELRPLSYLSPRGARARA